MRLHQISNEEAQVDEVFWGSKEHRTWEESEDDSDVSYDLDEEDEEESESEDSELDEDIDEEDEDEESEPETDKAPRKSFRAYKDPRLAVAAPKKREIPPKPKTPKTPVSSYELPETRHTTRARTVDVTSKASAEQPNSRIRAKQPVRPHLTQEQLMAEAAITEEWNKADLEAYVRYTELTDKEKAELEKGKQKQSILTRSDYRLVSRSFISDRCSSSEIRIHSPIRSGLTAKDSQHSVAPKRPSSMLLKMVSLPSQPRRWGSRYLHPQTMEGFNTALEFSEIEKRIENQEKRRVQKLVNDLRSLLVNKPS